MITSTVAYVYRTCDVIRRCTIFSLARERSLSNVHLRCWNGAYGTALTVPQLIQPQFNNVYRHLEK